MPEESLRKVVDEATTLLAQAQKDINSIDGRMDAFEQEKFAKMGDELGKLTDKIEQFALKVEASEKQNETLTKLVQNISEGTVNAASGKRLSKAQKEYYRHKRRFFRENDYRIPADVVAAYVADFAQNIHPDFDADEIKKFTGGLVSGIDPSGGYFVLPDLQPGIITRIFETSPIRAIASVSTTTSNRVVRMIEDDEFGTGGATAELNDRSAYTDIAKIGRIEIDINGQWARVFSSIEHLEDSTTDEETRLQRGLADRFSRQENTWFVLGDGSRKPKGFLNEDVYPAWTVNTSADLTTKGVYERFKLETIETETADEISLDDLTNVRSSLLENYATRASWIMHRLTWGSLLKIKSTTMWPLISVSYMENGAPRMYLLGSPVRLAGDVPLVAGNALAIAYGDFELGYEIVDRMGIMVTRDMYTEPGIIKFNAFKRTGGGVVNFDCIKRLRVKMA